MYVAQGIVVHNCTLTVRLVPNLTDAFEIREEPLEGHALAQYDEKSETVLFSPDADSAQRANYLIGLVDSFESDEAHELEESPV